MRGLFFSALGGEGDMKWTKCVSAAAEWANAVGRKKDRKVNSICSTQVSSDRSMHL